MTKDELMGDQPRTGLSMPISGATEIRVPGGWKPDVVRLLGILALFAGASAATVLLRWPHPFIGIWLLAFSLCIAGAMAARADWARALFIVCVGPSLVLALLEIAFATNNKTHAAGAEASTSTVGGYAVYGGDLGYAPVPGARATARRVGRSTIIYNVVYTISGKGVRATKGNPTGESWLFMGCSFAFGEGVNDDETLPALFSAELGYRANVVNFGFHGYGPHQMLRILETDRSRTLVHDAAKEVVYEAVSDHAQRAAGRVSWDQFGPRYALTPNGVKYIGPFHSHLVGKLLAVSTRSDFLLYLLQRTLYRATLGDDDIERYGRIVERSAQLAREQLGAGFTVLYWDDDSETSRRVLARLRKTGLPIILVSDIIPVGEWKRVTLPGDGHPTREANRRLAAALATRLGR